MQYIAGGAVYSSYKSYRVLNLGYGMMFLEPTHPRIYYPNIVRSWSFGGEFKMPVVNMNGKMNAIYHKWEEE